MHSVSSFYCYSRTESSFIPLSHSPSCIQSELSERYHLSRNPSGFQGPTWWVSAIYSSISFSHRAPRLPQYSLVLNTQTLFSAIHPLFLHASMLLCILFLLPNVLFLTSAHSSFLPSFISQQIPVMHLLCAGTVPRHWTKQMSLCSHFKNVFNLTSTSLTVTVCQEPLLDSMRFHSSKRHPSAEWVLQGSA